MALRKVDPGYDPGAVREGVEGTVVLYAVIHQDGKVDSVRVVRSLHPRLDENAVQALLRWQFQTCHARWASSEAGSPGPDSFHFGP